MRDAIAMELSPQFNHLSRDFRQPIIVAVLQCTWLEVLVITTDFAKACIVMAEYEAMSKGSIGAHDRN